MKKTLFTIGGVVILAACTQAGEEEMDDAAGELDDQPTALAENMEAPWAIVKQGDYFFVPNRNGSMYVIDDQGNQTEQVVNVTEEIYQQGESGLLGMALHPEFQENQLAYLYHTYEAANGIENRIISVSWDDENREWNEEDILLDGIPGASIHNGGRLAIGPDNNLYATTGDADDEQLAQDPENLAGNILRMELDGTVPSDNPFADSVVWSYGHRNPQGLVWKSDGTMYSSEHGPTGHDEINVIEAGNNYGWPEITGNESMDGMQEPMIHSGNDTWAPSGLAVQNEQLYMAGLRGEGVYSFEPENEEGIDEFLTGYGRIRDVHIVNNSLYFLTNNTDGRGNPEDVDDRLVEIELN